MSQQKIVVFAKSWRGYNRGESAGFDAEVADKLVSAEIAIDPSTDAPRRTSTVQNIQDPSPPLKTKAEKPAVVADNSDRP